jgi:two-component system NarL family response regulator
MNPIRIVVVDDHFIVREGLRSLIERQPDFIFAGQAANGAEAIQVHEKLKPDIMIIDLGLPVLSGVEAIRAIRAATPDARILVLSNFEGDEDIHASFEAGASGYILKHRSGEQIVPAIRALMEAKQWIPAEIARQLKARKFVETLTLREREIVLCIAKGEANKQISTSLGISEETVKSHVKNILSKLQAKDRTEAVTLALKRGIVHLPDF